MTNFKVITWMNNPWNRTKSFPRRKYKLRNPK
jgi:hypothetical protein